jgi:UDP-N-acetylglucosamine 2-epimerase (non-hydrolysing)/GDP/UDP-N,N'-diacetylbacillosamine 2-epimerase (hydrolysing)
MTSKKRKICILSGKRGGYGALTRTMNLIEKDPSLKLQLIVTDMHLSSKFGKTLLEVEKSFKVSAKIDMEQRDGSPLARTRALIKCLEKIPRALEKLKPDIFLCLGDRGEVLVSVVAAVNMGIPIAHIQGGDVSGNLDEFFRHAITKLSHIHFPSTRDSAKRIERMGEEKWRIFAVGDTHVDLIANRMYTKNHMVRKRFGLDRNEKYLILLQHPVSTEPEKSYSQMSQTLKAVKKIGLRAIVVYPCSDQGYEGIINAMRKFKKEKNFSFHKNIEAPDFLGLLSGAEVLVGNSSSGIIEAPHFKLPVVNIGKRQLGRIRDKNVIDVKGSWLDISEAIKKASSKKFRKSLKSCGKIYGDGRSAEKIVKTLKNIKINKKLLEKRMTY